MTSPVPTTGYATVADYEARYGDVPAAEENSTQLQLNDTSDLVRIYLGPYEPRVAAAYPATLTALVCARVHRGLSQPPGVRSESIGSSSVSYDTTTVAWLTTDEMELLNALIAAIGGNVSSQVIGEIAVGWGGPPSVNELADVDVWVLADRGRMW